MLEYLQRIFDLAEIIRFEFEVSSNRITVTGKDDSGRVETKQKFLSRRDAAVLFRLHIKNLNI